MNYGSSVLHISVEPATDCCRYVGVEDTTEQLSTVHIVECSCQIERDEHCSVSRLFREKPTAMSAVSSTAKCMSCASAKSHVEQGGKGCASVFWATEVFPAFWPQGTLD